MSKYGLIFERKPETCVEQLKTHHVFLSERDGSFIRDPKRHSNILIEGENYHALKALQFTHKGKIDCQYIDPPYNTGNKDFVYDDSFVDADDTFRHSKWLSFMEPRLKLAKELMSDRGIIFVSIDDNEFAQLKLLMDSTFGEGNFLANIIWKNKFNGGYDAEFLTIEHEYILVYAKNRTTATLNSVPFNVEDDKTYKFEDEYCQARGKFKVMNLDDKSLKYSGSLDFPIQAPDGSSISPENCWRWGKDKVAWGMNNGFLSIVKDKNSWRVNKKQYQYCDNDGQPIIRAYPLRSIIDGVSNTNSGNEIKGVFGDKTLFQYAKPVELIKRLLLVATQKDSIVLDFFAGSGTTGQAVAELNKEDGGTRQFILTTNNAISDKLPQGIYNQVTLPRLTKTIGNENLKCLRVETLKQDEGVGQAIQQLELNERLVPIMQMTHNTHTLVERGEYYSIFANHDNTKHLGIWSNSGNKQKPIDIIALKKFKEHMKQYNNSEVIVNRPRTGYAAEYYQVIRKSV